MMELPLRRPFSVVPETASSHLGNWIRQPAPLGRCEPDLQGVLHSPLSASTPCRRCSECRDWKTRWSATSANPAAIPATTCSATPARASRPGRTRAATTSRASRPRSTRAGASRCLYAPRTRGAGPPRRARRSRPRPPRKPIAPSSSTRPRTPSWRRTPRTRWCCPVSHNRLILDYTPSGGEDAHPADGWSIGDAYHLWHPGSRSWYRRSGVVLRLAVRGGPRAVSVVPGAPRDFSATPGSAQMELNWSAPSNNGGAAITDYDVRYQQGNNPATAWASAGTDRTETVTGLGGGQHTFEVRAVNSAGNGPPATLQATVTNTPPFTARFANLPAYHRGAADQLHYTVGTNDFTFELHFSEEPTLSYTEVPRLLEVSGGDVLKARRLNPPSNLAWVVPIRPTQNGDVEITLPVAGMHGHQRGVCKRATSSRRRFPPPCGAGRSRRRSRACRLNTTDRRRSTWPSVSATSLIP